MEYFIKVDGLYIMKKKTHFNIAGEIISIDWVAGMGVVSAKATKFNDIEKDFMIKNYKDLEVIKIA